MCCEEEDSKHFNTLHEDNGMLMRVQDDFP